jgi:hypothetical protein
METDIEESHFPIEIQITGSDGNIPKKVICRTPEDVPSGQVFKVTRTSTSERLAKV